MDKYMQQPQCQLQQRQQKELADSRRRNPHLENDSHRCSPSKKMRVEKEKENVNGSSNNNNDSSNSTSSPLQQGQGSGWRSRSPRAGFDPLASNVHKTPLPKLPPPRPKVVNWRLACFMAREYLSRGTLLGKSWPPQDSNAALREDIAAKPLQGDEIVREKERLYSILTTDFLRSDDVKIPGILNPSQLAAWLGFK